MGQQVAEPGGVTVDVCRFDGRSHIGSEVAGYRVNRQWSVVSGQVGSERQVVSGEQRLWGPTIRPEGVASQ